MLLVKPIGATWSFLYAVEPEVEETACPCEARVGRFWAYVFHPICDRSRRKALAQPWHGLPSGPCLLKVADPGLTTGAVAMKDTADLGRTFLPAACFRALVGYADSSTRPLGGESAYNDVPNYLILSLSCSRAAAWPGAATQECPTFCNRSAGQPAKPSAR